MNALQVIASFIASGRLHGVGIGSTLTQVDESIHSDFIDVIDEEGLSLRRDYGFVEFYFNPGPDWVMTGGSLELHKLARNHSLSGRWREDMHVDFPQYVTWDELNEALSCLQDPLEDPKVTDQGDFMEYRFVSTKVSVLVSNDHEERDDWVGHGDVWSVSLG
ncbi:hypothetical protein [Streptomyces sp. NPDC096153]|uniref:hypothetical protein n=1 Tax=Streptomyces sp. NPDC096153 TaxID=3155548 RepID=UPI00332143E6